MTLQVNRNQPRTANAGKLRDTLSDETGTQSMPLLRRGARLALAALLFMAAGAQAQLIFHTPQAVNTTSGAVSVTVTSVAAGSVTHVDVLTLGQTGLDFAAVSGGSTCSAKVFSGANQTCTQSVTFTPGYPGLRVGAVVLMGGNTVLGTANLSGVGQGGLAVLTPGNWIEIAGILKHAGGPKNGIPATTAFLQEPSSIALDGAGNLYIADSKNNQIRMICAGVNSQTIAGVTGCTAAGIIVEVAGTNVPAFGLALNYPTGVALDGAGNLYIADKQSNVIREITAATGTIATVAGNGYINPGTGAGGFSGDNGQATLAELNFPQGVTVDVSGNLFIADSNNNRIRRVDALTGVITTAVGIGTAGATGDNGLATAAELNQPFTVAFDTGGNMYIPDSGSNKIREVAAVGGLITPASVITTAVGTGGKADQCANGPTSGAGLSTPSGVALDAAGNIYISDPGNLCVRKTNAVSGLINTLSITNIFYIDANGVAGGSQVFAPQGLFVDGAGNVYFADHYFMLVDEIQSNKSALDFVSTPVRQGSQSAPQSQIVENDGNASLDLSALTPDANSAVDPANPPTTCSAPGFALATDVDCTVGVIFAPSVAGNPLYANIDVTNSTINNPLDIELIGNATAVTTTTISVVSNPNPSQFGTNVTFTATVDTGSGTGNLTGSVDFYDGATPIGSGPVGASTTTGNTTSAQVVLILNTLAVGTHPITVTYNNKNDPTHTTSTSAPPLPQDVYEDSKVTLKAVPASPSPVGTNVTFTATVTVPDGGTYPLDGTVTFTDSLATFSNNTVTLTGGVATYTATNLVQGVNVITATYSPVSTAQITGSSAALNQDVVSASGVTVASSPNPSIYGTPVTFTVTVPNVGTTPATGTVNIAIVPQGQATPVYNLTATLAGSPGAGTANISTLPVGTYTATANYLGDKNYGASAGTLAIPQAVNQVQTTTALKAKPNPGLAGSPVAITATVTPAQGTVTPTGTVTFTATLNGVNVPLTGAANVAMANGSATIGPSLGPGTYIITAAYSGDTDDSAGTPATYSLAISQATTVTTVTAAPSPAVVGATITFTATVTTTPAGGTPTGTVTFSAAGPGGTIALGPGTLAAGSATVTSSTLTGGTYTITASYGGDTNNAPSSGTTSETVGLIPTTTDLSSATVNGSSVLVAIVQNSGLSGPTPTGTVTFTSGATTIGSATLDASGVATLTPNLAAGTYTIVAAYGGDSGHTPSTSTSITITITTSGSTSNFTLTVNPSTVTVKTTQNATLTVTLTSINGFVDTIGLGCVSLPPAVNCQFASNNVSLAGNGTAKVQLTIDTNNPLGGGAAAMNRQPGKTGANLAGLFLPFSLLLGCILWRFRTRHAKLLSMVLVLILGGVAMLATGCGGFTQSSASAGTYTIQVVGVGENSNVTAYQNITLTVTN